MAHASRFVSDLDRMRAFWDERAQQDPVLAVEDGRAATREAFFAAGARQLDSWAAELAPVLAGPEPAALDYGCGAGRLLPALTARFARVVGADISPAMLERARTLLPAGCSPQLQLVDGMTLQSLRRHRFDLILAVDVLPHFPDTALIPYVLRQFGRRLAPGGLALVQLPDGLAGDDTFLHTGLAIVRRTPAANPWVWARAEARHGDDSS